jgi:hypothetical protein
VGGHGALREPGGAGRVEDRDVVVGVDVDLGHRGALDEQVVEPNGTVVVAGPDRDERGIDRVDRLDARQALLVADDDRAAGVVRRVLDLIGDPPGVERHSDRAHRGDGDERRDPLGVVAHRDADAIALRHAQFVHERMADLAGLAQHVGHRPPFVLEDDVVVGSGCCHRVEVTHVRWRVHEHLRRLTAHLGLADLEHRAGRAHGGHRFVERHRFHHGAPL